AELYEGGGHAAMLYDLLNHQVNKAWLRHPINTLAKIDVMTRSLPPSERWWLEKLETGVLADGSLWPESGEWTDVDKSVMHRDYIAFLDTHMRASHARRSTETELGVFL